MRVRNNNFRKKKVAAKEKEEADKKKVNKVKSQKSRNESRYAKVVLS